MLTLEQQNYAYFAYQETIKELEKEKISDTLEFGEFSSMYVFSNENLKEYLKKLNVINKEILTVASSGDQFINLALLGAKKIDNFDINRNASFMIQLKIAALKVLNYEEYLDFFSRSVIENINIVETTAGVKSIDYNTKAFDYKTYLKIKVSLPDEAALYWDMIYEDHGFLGRRLRDSKLLNGGSKELAVKNNLYLEDEENYKKVSSIISDLEYNFYYKSILELHTLTSKYDVILLSNIYSFLEKDKDNKITNNKFVKYITSMLSSNLNDNGIISLAYQFNYSKKEEKSGFALKDLLSKKFEICEIEDFEKEPLKKIIIPSVLQDGSKDCVYIYENN